MKRTILFIIVMLLVAGCANVSEDRITNFKECIAAGNPVMESYPRQCRAGDKTFVEEIVPPAVPDSEKTNEPEPNIEETVSEGITAEELSILETKEIKITAKRFEFIPSTITVNKEDKVKLILTSIDTTHGFRLKTPFIDINEQIPPNKETIIEFTATEAGEYDFWCSLYCGTGHGSMRGKLVVK